MESVNCIMLVRKQSLKLANMELEAILMSYDDVYAPS